MGFFGGFFDIVFVANRRCPEADNAKDCRKQEVDGSGDAERHVVTENGDERIARKQNADGRTQAVRKVEHRERDFGAALAHEPGGNEGERHADRNRDGERAACRKDDLHDFGTAGTQPRHKRGIVENPREPVVQRVVRHATDTDSQFHGGIAQQRAPNLFDQLACDKATDGKATHVDAERKHLPVARMSEEEFEVACPRAFVNEAREPGKGKQEVDEDVHNSIITNDGIRKLFSRVLQ